MISDCLFTFPPDSLSTFQEIITQFSSSIYLKHMIDINIWWIILKREALNNMIYFLNIKAI